MKTKWILGWGLVVLVVFNYSIWKKEQLIKNGRSVLLTLAPVDPRSLMQGDYMVLDYALLQEMEPKPEQDGRLVLRNDEKGVALFVGLDDGSPLNEDCFFMSYKLRGQRLSLGADSYFFQEGQDDIFESAVYGELVVDISGRSVLIGLRDKDFALLKPK